MFVCQRCRDARLGVLWGERVLSGSSHVGLNRHRVDGRGIAPGGGLRISLGLRPYKCISVAATGFPYKNVSVYKLAHQRRAKKIRVLVSLYASTSAHRGGAAAGEIPDPEMFARARSPRAAAAAATPCSGAAVVSGGVWESKLAVRETRDAKECDAPHDGSAIPKKEVFHEHSWLSHRLSTHNLARERGRL